MRPQDLLQLLRTTPFVPFRLYLSTGIVHDIRHPELAIVGRSTLTIEFPGSKFPFPVAARKVGVALLHIVQYELLPPAPHGNSD
jgi:hypothetical protein